MTNNTPDYNDNLYFENKMDCKNCPYTDEYCASGDCERNADVSKMNEIWYCKTITLDVKKGTTLSYLIEKLTRIDEENSGLVVPQNIQFSFGEMTADEVNAHYDRRELEK